MIMPLANVDSTIFRIQIQASLAIPRDYFQDKSQNTNTGFPRYSRVTRSLRKVMVVLGLVSLVGFIPMCLKINGRQLACFYIRRLRMHFSALHCI